jgi:hypothetical protein
MHSNPAPNGLSSAVDVAVAFDDELADGGVLSSVRVLVVAFLTTPGCCSVMSSSLAPALFLGRLNRPATRQGVVGWVLWAAAR